VQKALGTATYISSVAGVTCVCWVASVQAPGASCQMECDSVTFSLHFSIASRCLRPVYTFILVYDRRQVTRTSKRKGCSSCSKYTHAFGTWIGVGEGLSAVG
jgi:hypothetical protein